MARTSGTIPISGNFEVQIEGTFDARSLVPTYADLLLFSSTNYIANGFPVAVMDTDDAKRGMYICVDKTDLSNPDSWEKLGGGGGFDPSIDQEITADYWKFDNSVYIGINTNSGFYNYDSQTIIGDWQGNQSGTIINIEDDAQKIDFWAANGINIWRSHGYIDGDDTPRVVTSFGDDGAIRAANGYFTVGSDGSTNIGLEGNTTIGADGKGQWGAGTGGGFENFLGPSRTSVGDWNDDNNGTVIIVDDNSDTIKMTGTNYRDGLFKIQFGDKEILIGDWNNNNTGTKLVINDDTKKATILCHDDFPSGLFEIVFNDGIVKVGDWDNNNNGTYLAVDDYNRAINFINSQTDTYYHRFSLLDGSGFIANNNISWNEAGNFSAAGNKINLTGDEGTSLVQIYNPDLGYTNIWTFGYEANSVVSSPNSDFFGIFNHGGGNHVFNFDITTDIHGGNAYLYSTLNGCSNVVGDISWSIDRADGHIKSGAIWANNYTRESRFNDSYGGKLCIDTSSAMYYADGGNNVNWIINPTGNIVSVGSIQTYNGLTSSSFEDSHSGFVIIDTDGTLHYKDSDNLVTWNVNRGGAAIFNGLYIVNPYEGGYEPMFFTIDDFGGSIDGFSWKISTDGHINFDNGAVSTDGAGNLKVISVISSSSAPAITAGAGLGTGGSVSMVGNPQGGLLTITTGTLPTLSSTIATIVFADSFAYPNGCSIALFPKNDNAALVMGGSQGIKASGTTTGGTFIAGTIALTAATTFTFNYIIIGF